MNEHLRMVCPFLAATRAENGIPAWCMGAQCALFDNAVERCQISGFLSAAECFFDSANYAGISVEVLKKDTPTDTLNK